MRVKWAVVATLAIVALASAVLGAAQTQTQSEVTAVVVPLGSGGDHVRYAGWWQWEVEGAVVSGVDDQTFSFHRPQAGSEGSINVTRQISPSQNWSAIPVDWPNQVTDLIVGEDRYVTSTEVRHAIEQSTRATTVSEYTVQKVGERTEQDLGAVNIATDMVHDHGNPVRGNPLLRFQGMELVPGASLTIHIPQEEWRSRDDPDWPLRHPQALQPGDPNSVNTFAVPWIQVTVREFRAEVGQPALLGGVTALPVHLFARADAEIGARLAPTLHWSEAVHRTLWFAEDLAYPIRTDLEVTRKPVDSRMTPTFFRQTLWLEEFQAGDDPPLWDAPLGEAVARNPISTPVQPLPFPLDQATQGIRSDPTLHQYQAWRANNPGAVLVGAHLIRKITSACVDLQLGESHRWDLVYAVSARVYVVSAVREVSTGIVRNEDWGPGRLSVDASRALQAYLQKPARHDPNVHTGLAHLAAFSTRSPSSEWHHNVAWGLSPNNVVLGTGCRPYSDPQTLAVEGAETAFAIAQFMLVRYPSPPIVESGIFWDSVAVRTADGDLHSAERVSYEFSNVPRGTPQVQRAASPESARPVPTIPAPTEFLLASATSLALLAAVVLWPLFKGAFGFVFPGYAKVPKDRLLYHQARDALVHTVNRDPGITTVELEKSLGLAWSTLNYHLSVLERNRVVSVLGHRKQRFVFPVEGIRWESRPRLATSRNGRGRDILEVLRRRPGSTRAEIGIALGISPQAVGSHLAHMLGVGLVRDEGTRRARRFFAANMADNGTATVASSL